MTEGDQQTLSSSHHNLNYVLWNRCLTPFNGTLCNLQTTAK